MVYDILQEAGAGKRCSECGFSQDLTTSPCLRETAYHHALTLKLQTFRITLRLMTSHEHIKIRLKHFFAIHKITDIVQTTNATNNTPTDSFARTLSTRPPGCRLYYSQPRHQKPNPTNRHNRQKRKINPTQPNQ